jgi:transposase InsO family protein
MGKMARKPFPKKATPTTAALDCIVSDVCGPLQVESIGRKKYFVTFIDLYSRYTEVEFIREKSEVTEKTINFIEKLKTQFEGRKPKTFRSDRGMEYLNAKLQNYLKKEGIKSECTVGYAPEQNGVAERKNRTLMEAARTMLIDSGLSRRYWAEAVANANHVFNRIVNGKQEKSPSELMYGRKPTPITFHEFGCDAYVMIPTEKRKKLDNKAEKLKFLGYDNNAKGYRLVNKNGKITISREVRFLKRNSEQKENITMNKEIRKYTRKEKPEPYTNTREETDEDNSVEWYFDKPLKPLEIFEPLELLEEQDDTFYDAEEEINSENEEEVNNNNSNIEEQSNPEDSEEEEEAGPRRSARENIGQLPKRFENHIMYKANGRMMEPRSYKEATNSKYKHQWMEAMNEELDAIEENQTWELTTLPQGRKAIGSKWVFKTKRDEHGNISRFKARLVAQGFSQKFGIDYDEVFAPVARSTTLRLLLSVAGSRKYNVNHYDIKTAFLNGTLKEEIYLKQPPGFQNGEQVYRLKKSLYGLKQAARVWNETLHKELEELGYKQNETDKCLYVKKQGGSTCYLLIHVDDILAASDDNKLLQEMEDYIGKCFELKNLGGVKHFLGIDIERLGGKFFISQPLYIDAIVEEAGLEEAKTSKFPVDTGYFKQEGNLIGSNEEYRKLIGMLLYLTTNTRPDIAASVSVLSKRVESPRDNDMNEVKRVIRYLKGTRNLKLKLNDQERNNSMHAYSDANWAEDKLDRKSTTGYYCSINGGTISWCSRKQDVIALSSCESEYVALTETCKELVWLRAIAKGLDVEVPETTTIYTDSQSCIAMINNHKYSNRTKHIDTKYHYIREEVNSGRVKLEYCPTDVNIADLMTKPLGPTKTEALRRRAGLIDYTQIEEEC